MATVRVNGVELYYEDVGSGDAVVLVHGVWMSSRCFAPQLEGLADRHRVLALDLRGHGRSEHATSGHTVAQYARDLRAFLEALELREARGRRVVDGSARALGLRPPVRRRRAARHRRGGSDAVRLQVAGLAARLLRLRGAVPRDGGMPDGSIRIRGRLRSRASSRRSRRPRSMPPSSGRRPCGCPTRSRARSSSTRPCRTTGTCYRR